MESRYCLRDSALTLRQAKYLAVLAIQHFISFLKNLLHSSKLYVCRGDFLRARWTLLWLKLFSILIGGIVDLGSYLAGLSCIKMWKKKQQVILVHKLFSSKKAAMHQQSTKRGCSQPRFSTAIANSLRHSLDCTLVVNSYFEFLVFLAGFEYLFHSFLSSSFLRALRLLINIFLALGSVFVKSN